jgi:hypothetical protein
MSHHYSGPDWGFPRGDARLDLTDPGGPIDQGLPGNKIDTTREHPCRSGKLWMAPSHAEPPGFRQLAVWLGLLRMRSGSALA